MPETIALDATHTEQIRILERDLSSFGSRFDRHLEIYAQNGKELAALKTSVSNFTDELKKVSSFVESHAVTKQEFWPVKVLVFSFVGIVLIAVIGSLVGMVVINNENIASRSTVTTAAEQAAQSALEQELSKYTVQVKN